MCLILAENFCILNLLRMTFVRFLAKLRRTAVELTRNVMFFLDQVTAWPYFMRNGAASREVRQRYWQYY